MIERIRGYEPLWGYWKIDSLIGTGSTGNVYLSCRTDSSKNIYCAVKHIVVPNDEQLRNAVQFLGEDKKTLNDFFKDMVEHLTGEITIMHQLSGHTHIVNYHDHMIVERMENDLIMWDVLIRMECLRPLSQHLKHTKMTLEEILELCMDVLKALEVCHRHGIIHRDVKEENIFLNKYHTFKLGDFGISRDLSALTNGVAIQGSPGYMAPEIIAQQIYNPTADLYAIAMVVYKLLNNGRLPYSPNPPEPMTERHRKLAMKKRLNGEVISPPANCNIQMVNQTLLKALSFNPDDRYQTATAFRIALSQVQDELTYHELQQVM